LTLAGAGEEPSDIHSVKKMRQVALLTVALTSLILIPFVAVWMWIFTSTYIHPWLGLPTMYGIILAIVAIAYKASEKKHIKAKGSYDNFNKLFNSLYTVETDELRIKRRYS